MISYTELDEELGQAIWPTNVDQNSRLKLGICTLCDSGSAALWSCD
jgi:hypothetical protein